MGNVAYCRLHFLTVTPNLQLQSHFVPKEQASPLASQPGESENKADLKNKIKAQSISLCKWFKRKKKNSKTKQKPHADETGDQKTKTLISESPPLTNKFSMMLLVKLLKAFLHKNEIAQMPKYSLLCYFGDITPQCPALKSLVFSRALDRLALT